MQAKLRPKPPALTNLNGQHAATLKFPERGYLALRWWSEIHGNLKQGFRLKTVSSWSLLLWERSERGADQNQKAILF